MTGITDNCSRSIDRARIEPLGVDISDYSDEFCAGFLAGQASVIEEILSGRLALPPTSDRCTHCGASPEVGQTEGCAECEGIVSAIRSAKGPA